MKKLLCFALFSMAIVVNATEKKEIVLHNSEEIKVEKIEFSKEIKTEISDVESETIEVLVDCGEEGDLYYSQLMQQGDISHRDARSARRDFVRDCRGGTWAWLGFCVGFIGHCD